MADWISRQAGVTQNVMEVPNYVVANLAGLQLASRAAEQGG